MNRTLASLSFALLTAGVASAQNDECVDAIALGLGATPFDTTLATLSPELWPCASGGGPDLWYTYTAASTNEIRIETCGSTYDTALEVFTGTCAALVPLACNDDACGLQSAVLISGTTVGETYTFRVGGWNGNFGAGTITISEIAPPPPPPPGCLETLFASNNGGAAGGAVYFDVMAVEATSIGALLSNYSAAAGSPVGVEVYTAAGTFVGQTADPTAWTLVATDDGTAVSAGTDFQTVINLAAPFEIPAGQSAIALVAIGSAHRYTNGNGANQTATNGNLTLTLGAASNLPFAGTAFSPRVWNGALCEAVETSVGTNYCTAELNSSGAAASISASGSNLIASNDLVLMASGLPVNEFGVFIMGSQQGFTPIGNGNLCLGLIGIARLAIDNSGAAGEISFALDNTAVPTGAGFTFAFSVGDTWNFQAWFRDNVAGGANFTDGLEVTFE